MIKKKPTSSHADQFIRNVKDIVDPVTTKISKQNIVAEKAISFVCPISFFSKFKLCAVSRETKQEDLFSKVLQSFVENPDKMSKALAFLPKNLDDAPCKTVSIRIPKTLYEEIKLKAVKLNETQKNIYIAAINCTNEQ